MIDLPNKLDYDLLAQQIKSLGEDEPFYVPLMANAASLLYHTMKEINWAGFYIVRDGALILGPFNGKPACIRIEKGRGVCGTCWEEDKVQRVEDVHLFPGHIACDGASNSEIVIPIHKDGRVVAVLDIDSPIKNRFSLEDEEGLVKVAEVIESIAAF